MAFWTYMGVWRVPERRLLRSCLNTGIVGASVKVQRVLHKVADIVDVSERALLAGILDKQVHVDVLWVLLAVIVLQGLAW